MVEDFSMQNVAIFLLDEFERWLLGHPVWATKGEQDIVHYHKRVSHFSSVILGSVSPTINQCHSEWRPSRSVEGRGTVMLGLGQQKRTGSWDFQGSLDLIIGRVVQLWICGLENRSNKVAGSACELEQVHGFMLDCGDENHIGESNNVHQWERGGEGRN